MQHRLTEKDIENRTAFCKACNKRVHIRRKGLQANGSIRWRCGVKDNIETNARKTNQRHPHRKHKGPVCEKCGFKPEHKCQLDVDHIDGNHSNNELENLQTLCANCHRLKTQLERENIPNYYRQ